MRPILDRITIYPLYILPQHALSAIIYRLTRIEFKPWKNTLIKLFITIYRVDLQQAEKTNPEDYSSFNDFFTRKLNTSAGNRSKNNRAVVSPVDGMISQIGYLDGNRLIQAKGMDYSLEKLLAYDALACRALRSGRFSTLYLSPGDYHRIHMPITGQLVKSIYVPGDLFPVNTASVNIVDRLFTRNERFISLFKTDIGLMAQIMVGAIFVGSMDTVWMGQITPAKLRELTIKEYEENEIVLEQGDEFGRFNMGSTVILIFEPEKISWLDELAPGAAIQVGQILGNIN